jgi:hypothetical protein
MRERTKTTQKNSVVSTIQEEEIDSKIPKLKKVVLNPVEILDWNGIKKDFAQQKNIWRNLDGTGWSRRNARSAGRLPGQRRFQALRAHLAR